MYRITLISFILGFSMVACSPFKSQQSSSDKILYSRQFINGEISQGEYLKLLNAKQSNDPFKAKLGITHSEDENYFEFNKMIGLSYRNISRVLMLGLRAVERELEMPRNCDPSAFAPYLTGRIDGYNCGELPYGDIVDRNFKKVFEIDIDPLVGEEDKIEYKVDGFRINFIGSRQQRSGKSKISDLSFQKVVDIKTSEALFKSSYLQLKPLDNNLLTSLCTFVPGLNVTAYEFSTKGRAKREIIWGLTSLKGDFTVRIKPGFAHFNYAKLCGAFRAKIEGDDPKVNIELLGFEKPEFDGLEFDGIKSDVKVDSKGLLKFLDIITFGWIEKEIAKRANREIEKIARDEFKKITEEQVKSGEWLKRVFEEDFLNDKLVNNLDQRVAETLATEGPGNSLVLSQRLEAACIIASEKVPEEIREDFLSLCRNSFEIKADVLRPDPDSQAQGCYDHYFNPFETTGADSGIAWWGKNCEVDNEISINAPKIVIPLYDCITELGESRDLLQLARKCEPEIDYILDEIENNPKVQELIDRAEEIARETRDAEYEKQVRDLLDDYEFDYKDILEML